MGKLSRSQLNLAYLLRELGRLDEADESAEAAHASAMTVGDPLVVAYSNAVLALAKCPRGALEEAERALGVCRAILEKEEIEYAMYVEEFDALVTGYVARGRGHDEQAADIFAEGSRRLTDERLSVWVGQLLLFECVRALVRLGRREEAVPHRDRLERLAVGNVPPRAFLAWADGLLEPDAAKARDRLADAVTRFENLERPIDLGRCLVDLAEVEHRLGEEHRPTLDRAREILESSGALLFIRDVEAAPG